MAKPIELQGGLVAACTNTRPGGSSGPSGAGVLVGRGLGPTEGQTIRVGLAGRTATAEMVDRLLAALSGWPPVRCKGDVGTAAVGHPAGCGDGGAWSSDPVHPAAWTSPDGCAWRRAAVAPVTPDGQRTGFSLVARRGRLVAALGRSY